ncbi:MAG: hypothetical protein GY737_13100 [Desulfobacteraceae bacterium]|nr:hypothetical protein [Desulfobacteraceae bacterium]
MNLVRSRVPKIDHTLSNFGKEKVSDYLASVLAGPFPSPLQEREDLVKAVHQQTARLMGRDTADRVAEYMKTSPVISTVNHMGVDFTAHTLQGNLLFAAGAMARRQNPCTTLPVLSCGNIPLNNSTFPKGALVYKIPEKMAETLPVKVPLFPKRFNTRMVHGTPAFTREMVDTAQKRFNTLVREEKIASDLGSSGDKLCSQVYAAPSILAQDSYPDQACLLNRGIFRGLFKAECTPPELVFINMEEVVMALLKKDLGRPRTLAHDLFFTPKLLDRMITALSGFRGCWDKALLAGRLAADYNRIDPWEKSRLKGCGTLLFWGMNEKNRRVPLHLARHRNGAPALKGKDECGELFQVDFNAPALITAMEQGRLLPSNFTCFLVLAFARGLVCVGGYFQSEYLPKIRNQLVRMLLDTGDERLAESARKVAAVPCDRFFSAMAGVMCGNRTGQLFPAGALEMLAAPLSPGDMAKIRDLTVEEAFYASLLDTVMDVIPRDLVNGSWKGPLSFEVGKRLGNRVVVV